MDKRMNRAASNALGYAVDESRIGQALATHKGEDTKALRKQLRERVANPACVIILDLTEVHLVDLQSVRFLCDCQDQNIELRNCPSYIVEWIRRERVEGQDRSLGRRKLSDR